MAETGLTGMATDIRVVRVYLKGATPYSPGAPMRSPQGDKELSDAYDERCWRERCNSDAEGHVVIPAMAFKLSVATAAAWRKDRIKGKGQAEYGKNFRAGVQVFRDLPLPVLVADVESERLYVPAQGQRGGKKRVWRRFPIVREWEGLVEYTITDPQITKEIFLRCLIDAGAYIGIGRWRPENGGLNGTYRVEEAEWGAY